MLKTLEDRPIMTKYEYTRVLGVRIQQLIDGLPALVEHEKDATYNEIAEKELFERKLPLLVSRPIGYKKKIDIPVSHMDFCKVQR